MIARQPGRPGSFFTSRLGSSLHSRPAERLGNSRPLVETQDFPNNFFGTSSEDSALSDQATAIDKLTDLTDGQSATSPTSTGNGVGAASPNDIFGTENQKLNDIEADKLTKTEVHAQPENAAGIDVPALTRNETSTVAPTHSPITEAELSPANAFMRPGSIEEAASSSTGETTVSSQDDGDGVTSASSVDTVTSRVLSPEVTTPYGSDGATETAFSATNAPNALQETPPESFAAQPVHPVPFTQADVLSQSTSLPSNYGPLATDGPLVISSEGAYAGYPNNPAELSTGAVVPDQVPTGPFHTPSSYAVPQRTHIPTYYSPISTNGGILPGHATDYTGPDYSSGLISNRGSTLFGTDRRPTLGVRFPWVNEDTSTQGQDHNVTSEPPTHTTTDAVQNSDDAASLLTLAGETTTEGSTNAVPLTTAQYIRTGAAGPTESSDQPESRDSQHQSEHISSTDKSLDEATTIISDTTLHDSATDVLTTESSMTPDSFGTRAKMGRARTMDGASDPTNNYVDDTGKRSEGTLVVTPSSETEESVLTSQPVSPIQSNSESTPFGTVANEPTTTSTAERTETSTGKIEHATTADTATSSTNIAGTPAVVATQTSSDGVTESPITMETSTPVITATSDATAMSETTTGHSTSTSEGTPPETTKTELSQDQMKITTSNPEQVTSSPSTDETAEKNPDQASSSSIDLLTEGVTQPTVESEVSDQPAMGDSNDSSTQSPNIVSETREGTDAVTSEAAMTEYSVTPSAETTRAETSTGETSTSEASELLTRNIATTTAAAVTEHSASDGSQDTQTSPSDSVTTEMTQPVGREELATEEMRSAQHTTSTAQEEPTSLTTEEVTTSEQSQTTKLPMYEGTTTSSPEISSEGDGNAATTPPVVYRPDDSTTSPAETTTVEAESVVPGADTTTANANIITISTARTTAPTLETTTPTPEAETTAAPAATVETTTKTVETTTAVKPERDTTTSVGEAMMPSSGADFTTGAVNGITSATGVRTTTLANIQTTEASGDAGAEAEVTGISSASRSPKQLAESTSASLPEWSTLPSVELDDKHSFTTAPDLFSTTQSYTSSEASTTHAPPSVEPVGREITERQPWNTYPTTVSTIQEWKPSTETPFYKSGSPTSRTTEGDESCVILDGSLPVRCLLPEELNHTVTVKFGDLNRTREETFRTETRLWLLDYCNKNGIPLGEPTVVFLSGDHHMDHISFFVVNNTRGSVVPSDTVVAVLNSMKLTFEDRLGTAITDVFYGLPVLHEKDEPSTTFLGSSLGLVYVIVGAAVAAVLLLALLVVIMVKCRTLSSNQYSPDSEKLTKDLQMRAEMGDLRPADEILKEEAQLKESINGNGTHINGDGWVVPYSQIVNERKEKPDAQDTRL
ncbi:hypothetical protein HPB51_011553 [Rhipicephalus microplus]|uniref:Uncharacterized protein n=1 Tax=Rhipicephalus microplus TaxID=6941 RepID=A0A9J6DFV7_RHIMP|nr:hypothetical protein HPB51_011553 [Rhipicephalus microplus]